MKSKNRNLNLKAKMNDLLQNARNFLKSKFMDVETLNINLN